jgi:hypothetical protein
MVARRHPCLSAAAALPALLAALLLLLAAARTEAEASASVRITGYGVLARAGDEALLAALLKTRLDLQSEGNPNVRGQLQLEGWIGDGFALDIPRAYIKVRLPGVRLTLGKTRLAWGQGFVFNAGDVIFGSLNPITSDLSASELRDQSAWLAALYVPLGSFSFLEGVLLPYGPAAAGLATDLSAVLAPIAATDLAGGVRGVFKLGQVQLEAGYYASGREGEQRPYLGLQGHLLVDYQLAATLRVPLAAPRWEDGAEWLALSAGLFHLARFPGGRCLAARLEAAVRPGAVWREASGAAALPVSAPDAPRYGLYLFPELVFGLSDTLSLQLRALVSPVDGSAMTLAGLSWGVYQGLTLFADVSIMLGDSDDLYSWDPAYSAALPGTILPGLALTVGAEFIY